MKPSNNKQKLHAILFLKKLTVTQLLKKFSASYTTWSIVLTRSLSLDRQTNPHYSTLTPAQNSF